MIEHLWTEGLRGMMLIDGSCPAK